MNLTAEQIATIREALEGAKALAKAVDGYYYQDDIRKCAKALAILDADCDKSQLVAKNVAKDAESSPETVHSVDANDMIALARAHEPAQAETSGEDKSLAVSVYNIATRGPWKSIPPDWPEVNERIQAIAALLASLPAESAKTDANTGGYSGGRE
jgi:hypothetical protein